MRKIKHLIVLCLCLSVLLLAGCDELPIDIDALLGKVSPQLHEHTLVQHDGLAPTCTEDGYLDYETCSTCDEYTTYTVVHALGHDYGEESLPSGDHHSRFCSRCTATIDEDHDWQAGEMLVEPTCMLDGAQSYVCSVCDAMKSETVASLGHDYPDNFTPNGDIHSRKCSRCTSSIDAEHAWRSGQVLVAPGCETAGEQQYDCMICGGSKTVTLSALDHDYSDEFLPNGDVHSRHCSRCTSSIDGEHAWRSGQVLVAPGCETEGEQQYDCMICGASKTVTLSALDHDYSDEFLPNGDVHSRHCSRCTSTIDADHDWQAGDVTKRPNCIETGIQVYSCNVCHATKEATLPVVDEHIAAEEWISVQSPSLLEPGKMQLLCVLCGMVLDEHSIPAASDSIPVLYMTGDYASAGKQKNEVEMSFSYVDPDGDDYEGYALIKVQGATSVNYDKKNYTIKLYKASDYDKKLKIDLGWGKESKYVIKANWVDFIQARNVVSCRLWGDMVASRNYSANQERLAALPTNGGAIDGFPIMVFMNGSFHGLYTLNVPKDEWMFGMDDSETEAILCADDWVNTDFSVLLTEFTENSSGDLVANKGGWELKYCGTDDTSWVTESFNNLILFCQEKDGAEFKAGLSQYLDVDAAIDYLIYLYAILMRDNTSKNMIWATYDGVTWIPSVYDQDGTFGMVWDGKRYAGAGDNLPKVSNGKISVNFSQGNGYFILWDKLWNNFTEEILVRYMELRQTVLSYDNMVAEFEAFRAEIPEAVYEADIEKWAASRATWWAGYDSPDHTYYEKFDYEYIYTWLEQRLANYDNAMRNIYYNIYLPSTDAPII